MGDERCDMTESTSPVVEISKICGPSNFVVPIGEDLELLVQGRT